jgi:hypothetical protein
LGNLEVKHSAAMDPDLQGVSPSHDRPRPIQARRLQS